MPPIRFRIRTIMIVVAALAVLIVVVRIWTESVGVWHVSMDIAVLEVEHGDIIPECRWYSVVEIYRPRWSARVPLSYVPLCVAAACAILAVKLRYSRGRPSRCGLSVSEPGRSWSASR